LLAGFLADRIGSPWTLSLGGIIAIIAAIIFLTRMDEFRVGARQLVIAQGLAGSNPPQEIIPDGSLTPPFSSED
jgi:hypothetical protein